MSTFNESIDEKTALEWLWELRSAVGYGLQLTPGGPTAEQDSLSEVVHVGRLREAIRRLNFSVAEDRRAVISKLETAPTLIEKSLKP